MIIILFKLVSSPNYFRHIRSSNEKGIHPENYRTVLFYDSNAKQGFLIRSCAKTNNTMKWEDGNEYPVFMCDTSSASHPFYTGKTRQIGNEGRASEFTETAMVNLAHLNQNGIFNESIIFTQKRKNRPGCKIVRRHGVVYVISKTNPRFKARQRWEKKG